MPPAGSTATTSKFSSRTTRPSHDQSILSFNKLVDLQLAPLIFSAYSGPTLAMAPLATRKKVLLVNAGAQADKLATASPYLINTLPTIGDRDQSAFEIIWRRRS